MIPQWRIGPLVLPVHGVFLGLGVLAAAVVFIAEARRRGAVNDQSLVAVTEHRERVEMYLQYDGLSPAAHRYHRGGDLRRIKQAALRRLSEREIFTTLVMTAALGINDR